MKKNLPDSAIQILSNATRKDPKQPVFRYHLAMALLKKGDKSGARRECEAALAYGPGKADAEKIRAMLASFRTGFIRTTCTIVSSQRLYSNTCSCIFRSELRLL